MESRSHGILPLEGNLENLDPTSYWTQNSRDGQIGRQTPIQQFWGVVNSRRVTQMGEGSQFGQGQTPREMGEAGLILSKPATTASFVFRKFYSSMGAKSMSLEHLSIGLDSFFRSNTTELHPFPIGQACKYLNITFVLPTPSSYHFCFIGYIPRIDRFWNYSWQILAIEPYFPIQKKNHRVSFMWARACLWVCVFQEYKLTLHQCALPFHISDTWIVYFSFQFLE